MSEIAAVVLTLNEAPRIEECLRQFYKRVDMIILLDDESRDDTVKIARRYLDKLVVKSVGENFVAQRNYAWTLVPDDMKWIIWLDADERWNQDFLSNIRDLLRTAEGDQIVCLRFPRINLPDCKDFPDYQTRIVRNRKDFEWRSTVGSRDECKVWWKTANMPLDQADRKHSDLEVLGVGTQDDYPIIHLKRRKDLKRRWWTR